MNKSNLTHKTVLCTYVLILGLTPLFNFAVAKCTYNQPIELTELPIGIMLTWSTESEQESRWFAVERSLDGQTFSEIGIVEASGNSDELNEYHFLDVQPEGKRLFYRLKEVEFTGSYQFSDVIIHDNLNTSDVRITGISNPNQTHFFEIELLAKSSKQIEYVVKDWQGNTVRKEQVPLNKGINILEIDLEGKELGIYRVYLNLGKASDLLTLKKR